MRLKIIAGNVVILLLVALGGYLYVSSALEESLTHEFEREVGGAYRMFDRSWRLSAVEFVEQVTTRADSDEVRGAFRALDQNGRRRAAHDRANSIAAWFQDPARGHGGRPDIVLLTDETGRVLARDQDANRMTGVLLLQQIPALRTVLDEGISAHDAWNRTDENKLYQVGIAPIRNDSGGVVGALLVGYDISNGVAERQAEILGREVAFVHGDTVYSSSLEQADATALQSAIQGDLQAPIQQALGGGTSSLFHVEFEDGSYSAVAAALPATPAETLAYVVLDNKTAHLEPIGATLVILLLMGVGLLLTVVYGFLIGSSFLRPMEQIEEGILSVINGRTDTRLDIDSSEFGGLGYRVNQLINMLTGVEETDAEGHTAGGVWEGAAALNASEPADDAGLASELANEDETVYRARIYNEYVAAKRAVGEDVSNIPQDRFIGRLDKNAANLVKKHGCRMVRFQVQTKGSQVILRPVIIR